MHKHTQIFLASLLLGVLLPITTKALYTSERIELHNGPRQMQAGNVTKLSRRSSFSRALRIYEALVQKGFVDIAKPDINDPETIEYYLNTFPHGVRVDGNPAATQPLAPEDYEMQDTDELQEFDISTEERAALRRSVKTGKCWNGLFEFSKGFDALCKKLIRVNRIAPARTTGIQTDLIQLRSREAR